MKLLKHSPNTEEEVIANSTVQAYDSHPYATGLVVNERYIDVDRFYS